MLLSLLNIDTYNDTKESLLEKISSPYHIQFFTEINCEGVEKENVIHSDNFYNWKLIPKKIG